MFARSRFVLAVTAVGASAALAVTLANTAPDRAVPPPPTAASQPHDEAEVALHVEPAECPDDTTELEPGVCAEPDTVDDAVTSAPDHTHGGAMAPAVAAGYTYGPKSKTKPVKTPCSKPGTTGNRVQAIYVYYSGQKSRYSKVKSVMQDALLRANGIVYYSARQTGGYRHIKYVTDSKCKPTIAAVKLPSSASKSLSATATALRKAGYKSINRKYIVFSEARKMCGQGQVFYDDRPGAVNRNNRGDMFARVDLGCWSGTSVAHEIVHMLGAVQPSAARDSGGLHCRDEWDLMCYNDGHARVYIDRKCANKALDERLDCNKNDYFHTKPAKNSYLAKKWNVARSSFLWYGGPAYVYVPGPVRSMKVVASGKTGAKITFKAPTINSTHGAPTQYEIRRDSTVLTKQKGGTYTDTKSLPGKSTYWVQAINGTGRGTSVGVTVTLAERAPAAVSSLKATQSGDTVKLTWVVPKRTYLNGAPTKVTVTRTDRSFALLTGTAANTTVTDSSPVLGPNTYVVTTTNSAGSAKATVTINVTTPPAPAAVSVFTATKTAKGISLSWGAPATSASRGPASWYRVYRNGQQFLRTNGTSWVDTDMPRGTVTYYVVAYNSGGDAPASKTLTVTW